MADSDLTLARAREILRYDPETGFLKWLVKGSGFKLDRPAGCRPTGDYVRIRIDKVLFLGHRVGWLLHYGEWPKQFLDHINTVKGDDWISNLRDVPFPVNVQNIRRAHRDTASGLAGAYFDKKRDCWTSEIWAGGKHRLGDFDTAEAAHAAYLEAKRRLHPGCTI